MLSVFHQRSKTPDLSLFHVRANIKKIDVNDENIPFVFFEDIQLIEAYDFGEAMDIYQQHVDDMPRRRGRGYFYKVQEIIQFTEVLRKKP